MGHTPKADLKGKWEVCSPVSASDFSAVGYFFVRELYQKLNIPIGFIYDGMFKFLFDFVTVFDVFFEFRRTHTG